MKKLGIIFITLFIMIFLSSFSANAKENSEYEYDFSGVYDSLSEDAKRHLVSIGADSAQPDSLSALSSSFSSFPSMIIRLLSIFLLSCENDSVWEKAYGLYS